MFLKGVTAIISITHSVILARLPCTYVAVALATLLGGDVLLHAIIRHTFAPIDVVYGWKAAGDPEL